MAYTNPSTNRRQIIAALAMLPAATIAAPALARGIDASAWNHALAEYHRCYAAQEAFHAAHVKPACRAHDALENGTDAWREGFARICKLEEAFGDYVDRTTTALDALLTMPAPHMAALAIKLEIAIAEEVHDYTVQEAFSTAMLADVRRLGRLA